MDKHKFFLKAGDIVEVTKEFWFYADHYEVGQVFTIDPGMVMHNFEEFTKKVNVKKVKHDFKGKTINCICPICVNKWDFEHEGIEHHNKLYNIMISKSDECGTVEVICEECVNILEDIEKGK